MTSNIITITKPDAKEISVKAVSLAQRCGELSVVDKDTHKIGLEYVASLKAMRTAMIALCAEPKKAAHAAHKAITKMEKQLVGPVEAALSSISRKCLTYQQQEKARADKLRREAEERARKEMEEAQLAAAQAAQDSGQTELADSILDAEPAVPIIAPEPEVATVQGVSTRTTWSAEIVNFRALVEHVAAHPSMLGLLKADTVKLNGMARSLREGLDIPGVKAVSAQALAARTESREEAW